MSCRLYSLWLELGSEADWNLVDQEPPAGSNCRHPAKYLRPVSTPSHSTTPVAADIDDAAGLDYAADAIVASCDLP